MTFLFHPDKLLRPGVARAVRVVASVLGGERRVADVARRARAVVDRTASAVCSTADVVVETVAIEGPLDADRLGWVAELYGAVDPKYRGPRVPRAPLRAGPGRASAPRVRARRRRAGRSCRGGPDACAPWHATASRREARGTGRRRVASRQPRRTAPRSSALVLDALYALADARGFELIHAFVVPRVGRAIRFTRLDEVGPPSLVALLKTVAVRGRRAQRSVRSRPPSTALRAVAGVGCALSGRVRRLRPCAPSPPTTPRLLATPALPDGRRGRSSRKARGTGTRPRRTCASSSPGDGSRALVQLPGWPREPLRVAAWDSPSPGLQVGRGAPRSSRATGARERRRHPAAADRPSRPEPAPCCARPRLRRAAMT